MSATCRRSACPTPGATTPSACARPIRAWRPAAGMRSPPPQRLAKAGIETILDVVFNHAGESDELGPTLSLRGLDNAAYLPTAGRQPRASMSMTPAAATSWRSTGPAVVAAGAWMPCASGRQAGVGRLPLRPRRRRSAAMPHGFDPAAPLLAAIGQDPVLREPQADRRALGHRPRRLPARPFPAGWGEWNDRFRDDVRRFWRGDGGMLGRLATRLAGSHDIFAATTPAHAASISSPP